MNEIQDINLVRMNNGAHFLFVSEILKRAQSETAVMSKVGKLVDRLEKAVATEDECVKVMKKSFLSDEMAQADRDRDAYYISYKKGVEAFLNVPVKEMAEAAKVLNQHLKEYAIDPRAEMHKESGMLANFIGDLEGKYAGHVAKLSLTPIVTAIKEANNRVLDADRDRTDERLGTQVGATKAARTESDDAYRALVKMVNALALVATLEQEDGGKEYAPFIDFVNQQVTQYKRTVLGQKADAPQTSPDSGSGGGGTGSEGTGGEKPGTGGGSEGTGGNEGGDEGDGGTSFD